MSNPKIEFYETVDMISLHQIVDEKPTHSILIRYSTIESNITFLMDNRFSL